MTTALRLLSLQIVRAVAAWAVVFHHYVQLYLEPKSVTGLAKFFWDYGALGVDVFFVLSGLVMCLAIQKSTKGPIAFLVDRVMRIAPAYWFFSGMVILCIYLFPRGFDYTQFDAESLLRSATFIPGPNPSGLGLYPVLTVGWTLNYEMFFYASLACCLALSRRWFLAIFLVIFAILPLVYPYSAPLSTIARDFRLYEFWTGSLIAVLWSGALAQRAKRHPKSSIAVAMALVIAGVAMILRGSPLLFAVSVVAVALVADGYLRVDSLPVRALVHLGDISFSTYLAHCVVIGIAVHFTGKGLSPLHQLAMLLTATAGTYATSVLSFRWIEGNTRLSVVRTALYQHGERISRWLQLVMLGIVGFARLHGKK